MKKKMRFNGFLNSVLMSLILVLAGCSTTSTIPPANPSGDAAHSAPSNPAQAAAVEPVLPNHQVTETPWGPLFIPESLLNEQKVPLLIIHFHGSAELVRDALLESGLSAALLNMERPGLSAKYEREFVDPKSFERLVSHCMKILTAKTGQPQALHAPTRLMVSSFSAGFGAVREILKQPYALKSIDYVTMIDSLHAGFVEQPHRQVFKRIIDAELLASFVTYAKLAVAGKKQLLLTHSAVRPDGYASTTEVADYLLATVKAKTSSCSEEFHDLWPPQRCMRAGGLTVVGYLGDTAHDHIEQLQHMRDFFAFWKRLVK